MDRFNLSKSELLACFDVGRKHGEEDMLKAAENFTNWYGVDEDLKVESQITINKSIEAEHLNEFDTERNFI